MIRRRTIRPSRTTKPTYLGHTNDNDLAVVLFLEVVRQMGRLRVGIVPTNRVNDGNPVLEQLLGGDLEGRGAGRNVALFDAVVHVGQLLFVRVNRGESSP